MAVAEGWVRKKERKSLDRKREEEGKSCRRGKSDLTKKGRKKSIHTKGKKNEEALSNVQGCLKVGKKQPKDQQGRRVQEAQHDHAYIKNLEGS